MSWVQSFPPIISEQSKLLILGSIPGEASLKTGKFYANQRNPFWQSSASCSAQARRHAAMQSGQALGKQCAARH
jgi:G:T/U-mismatch repair DNA glycosylase